MAKMVLLASYLAINSVDVSDHTNKIEVTAEIEDKDVTTFGDDGWTTLLGGLGSGTLAVTFKNDFAASELDSAMWALLIARAPVTFEVRADNAAVGTSNPKYTGNVLLTEWNPISGSVGDTADTDVSWPTSGAISRATS